MGLATCDPPAVYFDDGALARGDDEIGGDGTLRYPLNNGYRSLWNGRYTSPDPLHLQSQLRFIGAQAYTYAAHRPQVNQDADGRHPLAFAALAAGAFWALGRDGPNGVLNYCPDWHVGRNRHQDGMCPTRRGQCAEDSWYSYQKEAALHCGKEDVRGRLSTSNEGAQCVYDRLGAVDETAKCGGTWDYVAPCPSWGTDPLMCSARALGHVGADVLPYLVCDNDGKGVPWL